MHNFRKLEIWKDAMALAKQVYSTTSQFPKEERYGLTSQINRCSVSVPSNIAEGSSRSSNREFSHFLKISLGSLFELETQLILSNEFGMLLNGILEELLGRITSLQRMIVNFLKKLDSGQ